MRDNSGSGKSQNNSYDPTLKEHEGKPPHRAPVPVPGDEASLGGKVRRRDEDLSPDDRERGETAVTDKAPPVDIDKGR
jgi:hypothetical protein